MVPANNLLNDEAKGTIAVAGVVRGDALPESAAKPTKLTSLRHGVLSINFTYALIISTSP